jgi:NTP pyrophosphatase (non-canonical NTP hydrolase)
MQLIDQQAAVAAWHRGVFGEEVPLAWLGLKLAEEAGEVCRAVLLVEGERRRAGRQDHEIAIEAADTLIVLLALADRAGFDLDQALRERFGEIVQRRFEKTQEAAACS